MKRLVFLLFLLAAAPALTAQIYESPDVVISTDKANIAGKLYFMHKVQAKQTIYSIGKAYGVTEEELLAANPDLKNGLKAGAIIFVPVSAELQAEARANAEQNNAAEPEDETSVTPEENEITHVIEHRVRWYESLNMIARKYGVTAAEIMDYNGMKTNNVVRGDVLLIPLRGGDVPETEDPDIEPDGPETPETPDDPSGTKPEDPVTPVRSVRWFNADEPLHIALILPFKASGNPSSQFLNFYAGALMAVQDQKEKGAHLVLNVYDLEQGSEAIMADHKFQESDLVVGPVEAATLAPFLGFAEQKGIPIVSPLDHKADSLVDTHDFLFQVPANAETQLRNLIASIRPGSEPVILLASNAAGDAEFLGTVEALLVKEDISYRKTGIASLPGILESSARRATAKVLIGSENRSFTTEAISALNTIAKKNVPMEVWCTNRVRNYEMSDPDALFNITAHTSAPYFVDYSDPKDQRFVLQYRSLYYAEPDDFAFQGYDVLTYFIASMMQQGSAFVEHAELHPMQLLHCNFSFVREQNESGWRNYATRHLVYNKEDYSITISK